MTHTPVNPKPLTWAHERAGLDVLALAAWLSMCRCSKTREGSP